MRRLFVSLIFCACAAAFSAKTLAQELFPQPDAPRRTLAALRLNAAKPGNSQDTLALAKALYRGTWRRRDYREAVGLFAAASARGSAEATAWLGSCYIYGRGVERRDSARGVSLIQAAAQADDAVGLLFLGVLHEHGRGVARDYAKAADLFSRAAAKGYAPAYARLGHLYMRGLGVSRNMRKAFDLFKQGAQLGDPWSQLHLGQLAFNGFVGPQGEFLLRRSRSPNYEMALQSFSQAAAQGNRAAAFKLAQMYERRLGVAQDPKKSVAYYRRSARAGDPRAQLALGQLSEKRAPLGPIFSYAWYSLAIRQGNATARDYLDALRAKMTPEQVRQAEALLVRWNTNRFCYGCR